MSTDKSLAEQMLTPGNQDKSIAELLQLGGDVDSQNDQGYTPLYIAAREGRIQWVRQLIEEGANINGASKADYTALHVATIQDHLDIVKTLIGAGADPNLKNKFGETPLYRACANGLTDIGIELIKAGSIIKAGDSAGVKGNPLDFPNAEAIRNWYQSNMAREQIASAMTGAAPHAVTPNNKPKGISL